MLFLVISNLYVIFRYLRLDGEFIVWPIDIGIVLLELIYYDVLYFYQIVSHNVSGFLKPNLTKFVILMFVTSDFLWWGFMQSKNMLLFKYWFWFLR